MVQVVEIQGPVYPTVNALFADDLAPCVTAH